MAEPLIRMENIRKSYGRVLALDDANFHVNEREIVGLLGDNGAGKSTLIKILSGAVPPSGGDIFIGAIILGMMALHSWLDRRHQAGS